MSTMHEQHIHKHTNLSKYSGANHDESHAVCRLRKFLRKSYNTTQQFTSVQYNTASNAILIYLCFKNHGNEMMVELVISKSDEKSTMECHYSHSCGLKKLPKMIN
jgi:hypothetical protein